MIKKIILGVLVVILSIALSYLMFFNGTTNKVLASINKVAEKMDDVENYSSYPVISYVHNTSLDTWTSNDVSLYVLAESRYDIVKVKYSYDLKKWKTINLKDKSKDIEANINFNNNMNKDVYIRVENEYGYESYAYKTKVMIDKTKPTVKLLKNNGSYEINYSDNFIVKKVQYSTDKLSWIDEEINKKHGYLNKDLSKYKYLRVVDLAENISDIKEIK